MAYSEDPLGELSKVFLQDFDIVFSHPNEAIDYFVIHHDQASQKKLLEEMKDFYKGVIAGRKSIFDLMALGLQYVPNRDYTLRSWFPQLISHLEDELRRQEGT